MARAAGLDMLYPATRGAHGGRWAVSRLAGHTRLVCHRGCVNTLHFTSDGALLLSGSDDQRIIIWDYPSAMAMGLSFTQGLRPGPTAPKIVRHSFHSGHRGNVFQAKTMPHTNNKTIVSCAADGQVRLALVSDSEVETRCLSTHKRRAHKLATDPSSSFEFLSSAEDGKVNRYDIRQQEPVLSFTCKLKGSRETVGLNSINIHPLNPNLFAVAGESSEVLEYDLRNIRDGEYFRSYQPTNVSDGGHHHITCLAFSENGSELLATYSGGKILKYDSSPKSTGKDAVLQSYQGHRNLKTVKGVNFYGRHSEYVVSGSDCGHIFIWDSKTAALLQVLKGDRDVVNVLEPHPYDFSLATSGIESDVKIWAPISEDKFVMTEKIEKLVKANRDGEGDDGEFGFPFHITPEMMMRLIQVSRGFYEQGFDDDEDDEDDEDEDEDDSGGEGHGIMRDELDNEDSGDEDGESGDDDDDVQIYED